MSESVTFGEWLKRRRKALDLTQGRLAALAHCSLTTIKRIESDDLRPSRDLAAALAPLLDVPPFEAEAFVRFARTSGARESSTAFGALHTPLPAVSAVVDNLPTPLTSLIGREREVGAIVRLVQAGGARLITLTGPPGTGKTRLGLAAADALRAEFPDGICFVALAAVMEPAALSSAIARALDVRQSASVAPSDALADFLRVRRMLLVLDNFEQIVAAGPQLADLLSRCAGVTAIVSSREVLRLYGERELPVPPLTLPDVNRLPPLEALEACPSIQLFIERARAVSPAFQLTADNVAAVARICAWLDGLPLAIEMAAARSKWHSPEMLLAQLARRLDALTGGPRDLSPRQQTLRGAIDWSFNLLDDDERRVFALGGAFAGGWTLEALAALNADEHVPAGRLFDVHMALVEKSLFRRDDTDGEPRYSMLETIREYARDWLDKSGDLPRARSRHLAYYAQFAEKAEWALYGADQLRWMRRMEHDIDNMHAALAWALEAGDAPHIERGLQLAAGVGWYWRLRGQLSAGRAWLGRLLAAPAAVPSLARARALNAAGILATTQVDYDAAQPLLAEATALAETRSTATYADASRNLAVVLMCRGRFAGRSPEAEVYYADATALAERCMTLCRELQDHWGIGAALNCLADIAVSQGDWDAVRRHATDALAHFQRTGDRWGDVSALMLLGDAAHQTGACGDARRYFEQALPLAREIGDKFNAAFILVNLASIALMQEDMSNAEQHARGSLVLFREMGEPWQPPRLIRMLAYVALARGDAGLARELVAQSIAHNRALDDVRGTLAGAIALAAADAEAGQLESAARRVGGLECQQAAAGFSFLPSDEAARARLRAKLEASLGRARCDALRHEGSTLSLDRIVNVESI